MRLHVTPDPDGRDLAGELIFQGYGWLDRDANFRRRAEYLRLEEIAWRTPRGIWRKLESPAGESKVVTGRHASEYHRPKCIHARHLSDVMDMSLNEAKSRRLVPCSEFRRPKAKR